MNEILIKRVNETNITIVQEGSDIFVPVHTITDALGVDFSSQRKRIMEDPILAPNRGAEDHGWERWQATRHVMPTL